MLLALLIACSKPPACPADMVMITGRDGPFCIHRFEVAMRGDVGPVSQAEEFPGHAAKTVQVSAVAGQVPTAAVSWYQARAACLSVGQHLCTSSEWEDACAGPPGANRREYPVLGGRLMDVCHIGRRDGRIQASGAASGCVTPEGVYDMVGNLWEWSDPGLLTAAGTPIIDKRGGGYYSMDVTACAKSAVGTHEPHIEGTIGFRCCVAVDR